MPVRSPPSSATPALSIAGCRRPVARSLPATALAAVDCAGYRANRDPHRTPFGRDCQGCHNGSIAFSHKRGATGVCTWLTYRIRLRRWPGSSAAGRPEPTAAASRARVGREHASPLYPPRTEANVLEADATLLLGRADGRGTSNTRALCARHGRPVWASEVMARHDLLGAAGFVRNLPGAGLTLNVAGSRESRCPGLQERAAAFVAALLGEVARGTE